MHYKIATSKPTVDRIFMDLSEEEFRALLQMIRRSGSIETVEHNVKSTIEQIYNQIS